MKVEATIEDYFDEDEWGETILVLSPDFEPANGSAEAAARVKEEDVEIVEQIVDVMDTRVRPSVQLDGGDIKFVGYSAGVVTVLLQVCVDMFEALP